jgi:GWxTD domain-containing protein
MLGKSALAVGGFLICCQGISGQIQAYLSTDQFWSEPAGNIVDVNLNIVGTTLDYAAAQNGEQANVEVLVMAEQDGKIVDFKKTNLFSPVYTDNSYPDLIHQERFALPPGSYDLVVELKDMHVPDAEPGVLRKKFVVADKGERIWFSDMQLAELIAPAIEESESRFGFKIVPYVSTYYPRELDRIKFYSELYNTRSALGDSADILLNYTIKGYEKGEIQGNYKQIKRTKSATVIPVIAEFDISDLASGNFLLEISVVGRDGTELAKQSQFFQRNNPIEYNVEAITNIDVQGTFVDRIPTADTLLAFVHCLRPISDDLERKMIDDREADRNEDLMKRFFYSFWYNRMPSDPEAAWDDYKKEVVKVNKIYGTRLKQGYQTDRGYVHLKYGAPNTITDRANDTDAYPYQIWHYYKAGRFNDKRFVFYLPDLVTNDYELLHSEVPGEVSNQRWNEIIHSRNTSMDGLRRRDPNSSSSERVDEYYQMPR